MKKMFGFILALLILTPSLSQSAWASSTVQAVATDNTIYINGVETNMSGFIISGSHYYSLRSIAEQLSGTASQFDVSWNQKLQTVEILTDRPYMPEYRESIAFNPKSGKKFKAALSTAKISINGQLQNIIAYKIDGKNYLQLRDLGQKIPYDVEYDYSSKQISVFSKLSELARRSELAYNAHHNQLSFYFPNWKSRTTSYLLHNPDQTLTVIEGELDVTLETYSRDFELISSKKITRELPLFGSFYSGERFNYIAFGQENTEENDNKEVLRIVRYDKNFNRIDSVSVKGGEIDTATPFGAGSGRMAEEGDTLVLHTSREQYASGDGYNHLSQLTIIVDTSTMKVTNDLGTFQSTPSSPYLGQYVLFDEQAQVLIDFGDVYSHSIVLQKSDGNSYKTVDLFKIEGSIEENKTGVSIGGFEMSDSSYIVAMNSIDPKTPSHNSYELIGLVGLESYQRDIILCVLPKSSLDNDSVKHVMLAKYAGSDKFGSIPKLVKISDDRMMVLWQEANLPEHFQGPASLKYVFIDGNGQIIGNIQTLENVALSDANPILVGDKIIWHTNKNNYRLFYSIPLD
jgi:hypothetical protein